MENNWREKETSLRGPMATLAVIIDDAVYQKINYWIQKAPGEVSGLGKVVIEDGCFRVIDAILVKQENTGASTDLDPGAVAKAMYELRDTPGHLNFWWHSHVNMAVFWSGTDRDTIREIGRHGFVVSTVMNKSREMLSSLYVQASGVLPEIFVDQLHTSVQRYLPRQHTEIWDKEYDDKCRPRYVSTPITYGDLGSYDPDERSEWPKQINAPEDTSDLPAVANDDAPEIDETGELVTLQIVEDWAEDMEAEPSWANAKSILTKITRTLLTLGITPDEQRNLKEEYIERFNISRKTWLASFKH